MKNNYLITTCLDYSDCKNKKKAILTGDWCFKESNPAHTPYLKLYSNIWDKTRTLKKDIIKLKKIHTEVNNNISKFLFIYNNKKLSKTIFKFFVHVWLVYYISFYYFKWKTLMQILSKNKNLTFNHYKIEKIKKFRNTLDFYNAAFRSNAFNYLAFQRILKFQIKNKIINIKIKKRNKKFKNEIINNNTESQYTTCIFRIFINIYQKLFNRKILIIDGFNYKLNILGNLIHFQLPLNFSTLFSFPYNIFKGNKNISNKKFNIKFKEKNMFKKFLYENLKNDIPSCFVENFTFMNNHQNKINLKPDKIVTSSLHIHNDYLKLWILKQKFIFKKKLIFLEHGAGHHISSLNWFNYQRKLGNIYIPWKKKNNKLLENIFPNTKYLNNIKKRNTDAKKILYVTNEFKDYIVHNAAGPLGISKTYVIHNFKIIKNNLRKEISKNLYFLPKSSLNIYLKLKLKKITNRKNILFSKSLNNEINKSKLIICTYPQTAFLESMLSGPTILIYNPKNWIPDNDMAKYYRFLKRSKIIFDDPNKAANHINRYWDNLSDWWDDINVKKSRTLFLKKFKLNQNSYCEFINCFKKINLV